MSEVVEFFRHWVGFLDFLAKATPLILIFGGLLAYFFREKLKQILARSLAVDLETLKATLAKEHAAYSAQLQRELEMYKVSLIAETEKAKAAQEVRKSIALKVAERRFNAIAAVMDAHLGIDTDIAAHVTMPVDLSTDAQKAHLERHAELIKRMSKYTKACDDSTPFLDVSLRIDLSKFRRQCIDLMGRRMQSTDPMIESNDEAIGALLDSSRELEAVTRQLFKDFEAMGDLESEANGAVA